MTASDSLFDSTGGFIQVRISDKETAEIEGLSDVAMATNFGTKIAITGFVCQTTTRRLLMERA